MSKNDKYENDFYEYEETSDFSMYDQDLEESVQESRRARREAKQRRKVKKANKVKKPETQTEAHMEAERFLESVPNDNIKIKSKRKKSAPKGKQVPVAVVQANDDSEYRPKKQKKGFLRRLISFAAACMVLYACFLVGAMVWKYNKSIDSGSDWIQDFDPNKDILNMTKDIAVGEVPDRTIALLVTVDKEYDDDSGAYMYPRTDSMVLANYDNVNKKLTLVSIPRDIMVEVSDESYRIMRSEFPEPGRNMMKMNEIHHYGGENHGFELLLKQIDDMFDVKPDYYVKVNFDGFNEIVDSVGGIQFDVPMDMDYEDPTQNLYIHLKQGPQLLDGAKAQMLVRFRKDNYGGGYANGDIDRLKVQQAFVKAFMEQTMTKDKILGNLTEYMSIFKTYVTTDAKISDMVRYASVFKNLDINNIETYTLPWMSNDVYGEYVLDEAGAEQMIYDVFKKPLDEVKEEIELEKAEEGLEKSNDKSIEILNGGYTDGMAREVMARLNAKDISVAHVGTYNEGKPERSVIYTSREGIGLDLVKFLYNGADVVVDPSKTGEYDIVVVVGVNEPLEKGGKAVTSEFENAQPQVINDSEDDSYYDDNEDDYDYSYDEDDDYDYDDDYEYDDDEDEDDYYYDDEDE
ncbi:MAG: LCP family protein [Firmicutes bacterium]|nr:LCP family protein [Bacillota bacterium]